jgi:hypothetical protein
MTKKETYIKIFLKQLDQSVNSLSIRSSLTEWWQNPRLKEIGGMRLTDEGYRMMTEDLDVSFYEVPYAPDMTMITQIIIWLDNFIDCPYYLGKRSISVTDDKKALELHMFSGDIKKYGISKALARQDAKND